MIRNEVRKKKRKLKRQRDMNENDKMRRENEEIVHVRKEYI